jgi:hypothetical protein
LMSAPFRVVQKELDVERERNAYERFATLFIP